MRLSLTSLLLLLCSACAIVPRMRPIERLCRDDESCWSQVREAPQLTYFSIEQAVSYGLAYLHEMPHVRYPQFGDAGVIVFPGPEAQTYRIDVVEVGIENHVMVQLGASTLAWAHVHPQPMQRDCSPLEGQLTTTLKIPVYVQHAEGPVLMCSSTAQPRRRIGARGTVGGSSAQGQR
jgi:hypothetical protein